MIEVVVRYQSMCKGAVFYYEPQTETYVGEVLPNPKHVANDCITMSGNGFIPYRVIHKRDIVTMGGRKVDYTPKPSIINTWQVAGSKGKEYNVTNSVGSWSCTCPGFSFRRDCRHIQEKKNEIISGDRV